jgi:hypothetical protein
MAERQFRLVGTSGRFMAISLLPLALAMSIATALGWISTGASHAWAMGGVALLGAFIGVLVGGGAASNRTRVELRGEEIDGPGPFRRRVVAPVAEIDRDRSTRRSRFQRAVGEQVLWLRNGERMVLNHRWYSRGELEDLLRAVGVGS